VWSGKVGGGNGIARKKEDLEDQRKHENNVGEAGFRDINGWWEDDSGLNEIRENYCMLDPYLNRKIQGDHFDVEA